MLIIEKVKRYKEVDFEEIFTLIRPTTRFKKLTNPNLSIKELYPMDSIEFIDEEEDYEEDDMPEDCHVTDDGEYVRVDGEELIGFTTDVPVERLTTQGYALIYTNDDDFYMVLADSDDKKLLEAYRDSLDEILLPIRINAMKYKEKYESYIFDSLGDFKNRYGINDSILAQNKALKRELFKKDVIQEDEYD